MSADPDNTGASADDPQSWNGYSYVRNSVLNTVDPDGLECVWDNGSFDAEDDPETGSARSCQNKGGTWVELGQNGNWSGQGNSYLQGLVGDIQNGNVSSVSVTSNGSQYTTKYNSSGQVTATFTPNGATMYFDARGSSTGGASPSSAGLALVGVGELGCIIAEPCGAGEAAAAPFIALGIVVAGALRQHQLQFSKSGGKEQERIRAAAAEAGVSAYELGAAIEAYKEANGIPNDATLGYRKILEIARQLRNGDWWSGTK